MKKVAIVYWSGTGNTEAMAAAVDEGVKAAGGEAVQIYCSEFNKASVKDYDAIAFGCPSMGDEVLEESEFDPMFEEIEDSLGGKSIGLFGSYGWGDGQWMRDWSERCDNKGARQVSEFVICNGYPGDDAVADLKALGAALAK